MRQDLRTLAERSGTGGVDCYDNITLVCKYWQILDSRVIVVSRQSLTVRVPTSRPGISPAAFGA